VSRYEQAFLLELTHRLATAFPARSAVATELSDWFEEHDLGFVWDPQSDMSSREWRNIKRLPSAIWEDLRSRIAERASKAPTAEPDALARNVSELSAHLGLNRDEERIFALAVRAACSRPLESLCECLVGTDDLTVEDAVARLTGIAPSRVRKAIAPSATLTTSGLLERDDDGLGLVPLDRLLTALGSSRGLSDTLEKLFTLAEPAKVEWEDFEHLGPSRDFVLRLLKGAAKRGAKGVNVLLHGETGTGKTEFCKALSERLGARLYAAGESDEDGDEPSRTERLQELRLYQRLLANQDGSLVLFDEMEDLSSGFDFFRLLGLRTRGEGSKVHMNRLLETNPVPILWTTNSTGHLDRALMRRFTFSLELRKPPVRTRAGMWQKLAKQHRVPLSLELCTELAQNMENAPGIADGALRAAQIAGGGTDDVRLAATALSRAVRGRPAPPVGTNVACFDPALANADHDLDRVTRRYVARGTEDSGGLCLSGPPGSGKSAFARYLAERLNMDVLERRASDLLDPYVGRTEHRIAGAFAEARDTKAFLIFDEADSMLCSRTGAHRSWEITRVNEMLTWMESHPLPFACTTNLVDRLDPAAARRFGLRINFLPLGAEQRALCFRRFFDIEPPSTLDQLDELTPGDFAVVRKRIKLLGIADPEEIVAELRRERESKPSARDPVGFTAAGQRKPESVPGRFGGRADGLKRRRE